MPFDNATFALECVKQGRYLGASPHFMMMVAQLHSHLSDTSEGDSIGPFRVEQGFWDANSTDAEFEIVLQPGYISSWRIQCIFVACLTRRLQNDLIERFSADGRYPTVLELYRAQWPARAGVAAPQIDAALAFTAPFIVNAMRTDADGLVPGTSTHADSGQPASPPQRLAAAVVPHVGEQTFTAKAPRIMERLMNDFGLKDYEAAGVLGNIGHECAGFGIMQEIAPKSGRGGLGWCQWTGSRRVSFETFCADLGVSTVSDEGNYGYLRQELRTLPYRDSIPALQGAATLAQAVRNFERVFEQARVKLYDRRERWATLALGAFSRKIPASVGLLVDPNADADLIASAEADGTTYWLLDERAEGGGQVLVAQAQGQGPQVLARDTALLPLPPGLVPTGVATALSGVSGMPSASPAAPGAAAGGAAADLAARVLASAKACDEALVTRDAPGTNHGHLACAWAVNEVVRRANGKPIGGGASTAAMVKVLSKDHDRIDPGLVTAGMIVISPTKGKSIGHVGIVGDLAAALATTTIYSNSSKRGIFTHRYTLKSWNSFYGGTNGLDVEFIRLRP